MAVEVFLRNCRHSQLDGSSGRIGYALKCDQVSVTYAKTPIQVPIPKNDPILEDVNPNPHNVDRTNCGSLKEESVIKT